MRQLSTKELSDFTDYVKKLNKKYGIEIDHISFDSKGGLPQINLKKGITKLAKLLGKEIEIDEFDYGIVDFTVDWKFSFWQDKKTYLQEIGELDKIIERWLPNGD